MSQLLTTATKRDSTPYLVFRDLLGMALVAMCLTLRAVAGLKAWRKVAAGRMCFTYTNQQDSGLT